MNADRRQGTVGMREDAALAAVHRRLRGVLEAMTDAVAVFDREWRFVYANPRAEALCGQSVDELRGRVLWDLFPGSTQRRGYVEYHRALESQEPATFEEFAPELGRWFRHHLFPCEEGLTVSVRDITARKAKQAERARDVSQSEKRFRALIENSCDAVVTVDRDGRTLYASPSCARVDGFRHEYRIGAKLLAGIHPADAERAHADFARVASTPQGRVSGEYRVLHASGRWIWIEAEAQNLMHDEAIAAIVVNFRDVTQRREAMDAYRQAEQALRRSERHYRALIDNGHDLISIIDAAGVVRYASPSHERILGWPPDELVGRSGFEWVHEDDVSSVLDTFTRGVESGASGVSAVFRYRHKDGSWRVLEAVATQPPPDSGLDGFIINSRDVTERRSAEQRTRMLLEVTREIGSTLDATELLDRVQKRIAMVLPCDAVVTFLRDPVRGTFRMVAHTGLPDAARESMAALEVPDGAFTAGRLEGGTLVVNDVEQFAWGRPLDRSFAVRALLIAALRVRSRHLATLVAMRFSGAAPFETRDTELFTGMADQLAVALERVELYRTEQEAAEVFGSLARVGQDLLASFDTPRLLERLCHLTAEALGCESSHLLLWSAEDSAYLPVAAYGVAPEDWEALRVLKLPRDAASAQLQQLGGETLQLLVAGGTDAGVMALLRLPAGTPVLCLALRRGEEIIGFHTAARPRDGRPFSEVRLRIARGIAHLASMALEHARINDELGRANRLKSEFVAMMSHELRTPLNPIIGYGDLLLEGAFGTLNDEQAEVLRRMQRSSRGLLELIEEVLDLSRLESGRITLDLREVSLATLLDAIDAETLEMRRSSGVALRIELPPDLPTLMTDPAKLKVVLKNLVVNAFKFTVRGSVTVAAGVREAGLAITVADTGIGIAPDNLAIIFEPFRQGEGALLRQQGGVGLGLYIVRRLLDALGGTIAVESRVGVGSTFHVWVPGSVGAAAAEHESPLGSALTSSDTQAAAVRRDGTIVAVNDAWRAFAGGGDRTRLDVGANYFAACASASGPEALTALEARVGIQSVAEGMRERFSLEYAAPAADRERWFLMTAVPHPGHPGEVLVMHTDVTEHRHMREAAAQQLPSDPLTGLPNRSLFVERLDRALAAAELDRRCVGVLYLDLDHFKRINEMLGRAAGDQLLQLAARRIEEATQAPELLSRPGGDEFLVLVPTLERPDQLFDVATRIVAALAEPFHVDGKSVLLQASVGLALAPEDGRDADSLLRRADIALSEAKRAGRGGAMRPPFAEAPQPEA